MFGTIESSRLSAYISTKEDSKKKPAECPPWLGHYTENLVPLLCRARGITAKQHAIRTKTNPGSRLQSFISFHFWMMPYHASRLEILAYNSSPPPPFSLFHPRTRFSSLVVPFTQHHVSISQAHPTVPSKTIYKYLSQTQEDTQKPQRKQTKEIRVGSHQVLVDFMLVL
jgi:hypothetical protein